MKKERLDVYLVNSGYCESRNKAQDLISKGFVQVNQKIVNKSNFEVIEGDDVVLNNNLLYVSRAGYKLLAAIEEFHLDFKDKVVLDVGASTGGFSDCAIQHGATKIYCVDVGTNQLHPKIKDHPAVIDLSPLNIKDLDETYFSDTIDIVVSDISFISSKYMFAALTRCPLKKGALIVSLIKPQYELSPQIIAKHKGVVKDPQYHQQAIKQVVGYAQSNGFKNIGIMTSPITGAKKNNTEFLGLFKYE